MNKIINKTLNVYFVCENVIQMKTRVNIRVRRTSLMEQRTWVPQTGAETTVDQNQDQDQDLDQNQDLDPERPERTRSR